MAHKRVGKRRAYHAGSWYSNEGAVLSSQLDEWLKEASSSGTSHCPSKAIIAPHAGYSYSGPTAAFAYSQIDPKLVKRVFILGPSHHMYLPDCALSSNVHYETPLYDLTIDMEVYKELEGTGKFSKMNGKVDEEEHSIEMHLPYVAKVMEGYEFKIVPILVGALKQDKEALYGELLSKYLADEGNLFVVSSDFCHWGQRFNFMHHDKQLGPIYSSIEALDRQGMSLIEQVNASGFKQYLQTYGNTICGRHPISILLHALQTLQSSSSQITVDVKFLKYAQSNQCKSPKDSSVSYASASVLLK